MTAPRRVGNPFWVGEADWGEHGLFFERPALVELDYLPSDPAVAVAVLVGPRRIGKTSILHRLEQRWRSGSEQGLRSAFYIDVRNYAVGARDPRSLCELIDETLVANGHLDPAGEVVRDLSTLAARWRRRRRTGGARVRLLLDETEMLHQRDPQFVVDLIECFEEPGDPAQAFVLVGWGRWLGTPMPARLSEALRNAPTIALELLTESDLMRQMRPAFERAGFSARDAEHATGGVWEVSRGHPWYAMAVAHEMFKRYPDGEAASGDRLTLSSAMIRTAWIGLERRLSHVWDQVSRTQQALCWGLARRAVASPLSDDLFDVEAARRSSAIPEVCDHLAEHGTFIDVTALRSVTRGLIENFIIERDDSAETERWRVRTPFFAAWLASREFRELDADLRRVDESTGKSALDMWVESGVAAEEGDDERAAELLQRALLLAPYHPDLLVDAARVARRRADLPEAAFLLRKAQVHGHHEQIRLELAEVLEKQLEVALAEQSNPLVIWAELRTLSSALARAIRPALARGVIDAWAARWRQQVEQGRSWDAEQTLDELERTEQGATAVLIGWRARFLDHYAAFMRTFPQSVDRLVACLDAIAHSLVRLTAEIPAEFRPPEPSQPLAELPGSLRDLIAHIYPDARVFGDLDDALQAKLVPDLERRYESSSPAAWRATLDVLIAARQCSAPLPRALDAAALRALGGRAPRGIAGELREWQRSALVPLAVADLAAGGQRAGALLDLLWDVEGAATVMLDPLLAAVDELALSLPDATDDLVVDAFRSLPALLSRLHRRQRPNGERWLTSTEVCERAEYAIAAARRGNDKASWRVVAANTAAVVAWCNLLASVLDADGGGPLADTVSRLVGEITLPIELSPMAAPVDQAEGRGGGPGRPSSERRRETAIGEARALLDPRFFQIDAALDPPTPVGTDRRVLRLRGMWRRSTSDPAWTPTHVKLYQLPSDRATRDFLEALWNNERRVLFDVGSRRKGRALAELRHAELRKDRNYLVLVTEPVGQLTLRDLLDRRSATEWRRRYPSLMWRELLGLMQALEALHDAHYMHRNLRPDTISVRFDDTRPESFRFKLVDFEWSIYLHAVNIHEQEGERRVRDYYCAPEGLTARSGSSRRGETHASDLYALGLILFELLIRPLSTSELKQFSDGASYSAQAHGEFIEGLRDEVRDRRHDLSQAEQLLVLGFLRYDAGTRLTTLRSAIAQVRKFALGAEQLQQRIDQRPLRVIAALRPGTPESIAGYIMRHPEGAGLRLTSEDETSDFIAHQLVGARVYENATSGQRRLYIEGKQMSFTAMPFRFRDQSREALAYLYVETRLDSPVGDPLVVLKYGVEVCNLLPPSDREEHLKDADKRWEDLFRLVKSLDVPSDPREEEEQAELHSMLEETAQAEAALLEEQIIAYKIVDGPLVRREFEVMKVEPRPISPDEERDPSGPWQRKLRQMIARNAQIDGINFELAYRRSSSDWNDDTMRWQVQNVDSSSEQIELRRVVRLGQQPPPPIGWVRPVGIAGSQALLARRRNLLRRLEGDRYILGAISRPAETHREMEGIEPTFFQPGLDGEKRRIVTRMQTASPMLLVQGPPGTGKTTLATEVVLQALDASPAVRILITAQGHDPLNHLLGKIDEEIARLPADDPRSAAIKAALKVRVVPERRLTLTDEMSGPRREIEGRFHPVRVAKELLERSREWEPDAETRVQADLLAAWRRFVDDQLTWSVSLELQRRLLTSANIVCTTANDRTLDQATQLDRPFDLLVYEEAGRALPLELIGPMTNATRSLIIGDPKQLPPHQARDLRRILSRTMSSEGDPFSGDSSRIDGGPLPAGDIIDPTRVKAIEYLEIFSHLWNQDHLRIYSDKLTLQYRMHPLIADTVSKAYYQRELQSADPVALRDERQHRIVKPGKVFGKAIVWIDVPWVGKDGARPYYGDESAAAGGYTNYAEVRAIQRFFSRPTPFYAGFQTRGGPLRPEEMVFISPYRGQVEMFRRVFERWRGEDAGSFENVAHTVDSFQGRQADIVVVSLVRNNRAQHGRAGLGFLEAPSRSVVMFSRAQSLLLVVGCREHFQRFDKSSPIREFLKHVNDAARHGEALFYPAEELFTPHCHDEMSRHWSRRSSDREFLRMP